MHEINGRQLIIYASKGNPDLEKAKKLIAALDLWECSLFVAAVTDLVSSLTRLPNLTKIALLMLASKRELAEVAAEANLLHDVRTILVLPGQDRATLAAALKLRPSFYTFSGSDLSNLGDVLQKLLRISAR